MGLATTYSRTTYRCTTIGERAFHFRVRYGNGWGHASKVTRLLPKRIGRVSGGVRDAKSICVKEPLIGSLKTIGKGPLF